MKVVTQAAIFIGKEAVQSPEKYEKPLQIFQVVVCPVKIAALNTLNACMKTGIPRVLNSLQMHICLDK